MTLVAKQKQNQMLVNLAQNSHKINSKKIIAD